MDLTLLAAIRQVHDVVRAINPFNGVVEEPHRADAVPNPSTGSFLHVADAGAIRFLLAYGVDFTAAETPEECIVPELTRPDVEPPEGPAPDDLVIDEIVLGEGSEATAGVTVLAHYTGVTHDEGDQFDSSWDRGDPLAFRLGVGQVIAGWDQGILGMRVGGRRRLTIPAHLAYGDRGAGGVIKPGAALMFVVDLVDIR